MIYLLIFSLIVLNAYLNGRYNNLILIVLCSFSGFRYKTGLDYENYDLYFESLPKNIWDFEFGFHFLSLISHYCHVYHYLFFSVIIFLILTNALRHVEKTRSAIFLVIFTYYGYWNVFSVLRQSIACVLFFYVFLKYDDITKKNRYVIYFIAFSMHYSAIFFVLVIEFILPILLTKRNIQVLLVIISIIFIQFKIDSTFLIPEPWKYALEITSLLKEVKFNLRYLEMIIVFILSFYFLKDKFNVKLVTLASIQLFFYSFFSSISYLSERFNVYFDLFYALLFSAVLVKLITFVKEKYIFHKVIVTFISFFIALRYYQYIFKADYSEIPSWELSNEERFIPYQSIFKERNERKY